MWYRPIQTAQSLPYDSQIISDSAVRLHVRLHVHASGYGSQWSLGNRWGPRKPGEVDTNMCKTQQIAGWWLVMRLARVHRRRYSGLVAFTQRIRKPAYRV